MPSLLEQVQELVAAGRWKPSDHGEVRRDERGFDDADLVDGISEATVIESYPGHRIGPCFLALQYDRSGNPIHVVWGFKYDPDLIALVITAYYPGLDRWEPDFIRRRQP